MEHALFIVNMQELSGLDPIWVPSQKGPHMGIQEWWKNFMDPENLTPRKSTVTLECGSLQYGGLGIMQSLRRGYQTPLKFNSIFKGEVINP